MILEVEHATSTGRATTVARWEEFDGHRDLAGAMTAYAQALQPGGRLHYVAEAIGYEPTPFRAWLKTGKAGFVLESWSAQ